MTNQRSKEAQQITECIDLYHALRRGDITDDDLAGRPPEPPKVVAPPEAAKPVKRK